MRKGANGRRRLMTHSMRYSEHINNVAIATDMHTQCHDSWAPQPFNAYHAAVTKTVTRLSGGLDSLVPKFWKPAMRLGESSLCCQMGMVSGAACRKGEAREPYVAVTNLRVVLEGMQHSRPLCMTGAAIDEGLLQHYRIVAQRKYVVREHNDLVSSHLPDDACVSRPDRNTWVECSGTP